MSPIFIGGAGRSGTTLLIDLLGLHPAISPIYETDFVVFIARMLSADAPPEQVMQKIHAFMDKWTESLPHRPHNKREHERFVHGPHHILFDRELAMAQTQVLMDDIARGRVVAGFRHFMSTLFSEHAHLDNKPRWANKTPAYVRMLPVLRMLYPDMKFIHRVRDGRDVACSIVTRPFGPKTYEEAARWWAGSVGAGVQFARQHPDQVRVVRYEDLLSDPVACLEPVLHWLGEDDVGELLSRHTVGLDPSRSGRWREDMPANDNAAFKASVGDLLLTLGYAA